MDAKLYTVKKQSSIQDALQIIDANKTGAAFVIDDEDSVIGIVTDGDIRRWLIRHNELHASIENCANKDFVYVLPDASRETILKLLDHRIKVLPILNEKRRLVAVYNREYFPPRRETRIYARARAPVRISFSGGGSDLTHIFVNDGGVVLNAAISLYSRAVLKKRDDSRIKVLSEDLKDGFEVDDFNQLSQCNGKFKLIVSVLKVIHPDFGFELQVGSEFPIGSGLGGSAAVLIAIIGCFNQFREDRWDSHEIAEIAYQAERLHLNVTGGWQDQYASVFGGFNFMEFTAEHNIIHPLRLEDTTISELEECLLLCDTGVSHDSGAIHEDQKERSAEPDIRNLLSMNKQLTLKVRNYLLKGQLTEFGRCLDQNWLLKRKFSKKISNSTFDDIYDYAIKNGAIGGKLLGAGGGGMFLFFVPSFKRFNLEAKLSERGLSIRRFRFDNEGLKTWLVRMENNIED